VIDIRCWKHKAESLAVVEVQHVPGEASILVSSCPKCLAEADAHGYEVGEADARVLTVPREPIATALSKFDSAEIAYEQVVQRLRDALRGDGKIGGVHG